MSADLAPRAAVGTSDEGRGVVVAVRVVDERPSKSLGRRGGGFGPAAEITAKQDLAAVVDDQVREALRRKNFRPVPYSTSIDPRLTVELRLLEYSTSVGFWTGGVHVKGALKTIASRGPETYERLYRAEKEERVLVVPTAEANEAMINTVLTDLLAQMFDDRALFGFLAPGAGGSRAAPNSRPD